MCDTISDAAYDDDRVLCLESMVTYAGDVYLLNSTATLFKIVWSGDHWNVGRLVDTLFHDGSTYLVESAGKLLLVQDGLETVKIFSVYVEQKVLEAINCIGSCHYRNRVLPRRPKNCRRPPSGSLEICRQPGPGRRRIQAVGLDGAKPTAPVGIERPSAYLQVR